MSFLHLVQADVVISLLPPSCHNIIATACIEVLNNSINLLALIMFHLSVICNCWHGIVQHKLSLLEKVGQSRWLELPIYIKLIF